MGGGGGILGNLGWWGRGYIPPSLSAFLTVFVNYLYLLWLCKYPSCNTVQLNNFN
jgi:hypothetical protein